MKSQSAPRYPAPIQFQIAHAGRFSRALRALHEDIATENVVFLWLEGRADEVEVFTVDVLRAWSAGTLGTREAARAIEDYLEDLHARLEGWYGQWYAPSCCGPLAREYNSGVQKSAPPSVPRRPDTLLDTVADAPAADVSALTADRDDDEVTARDRERAPIHAKGESAGVLPPRPAIGTKGESAGVLPPRPAIGTKGESAGVLPPRPAIGTKGESAGALPSRPPIRLASVHGMASRGALDRTGRTARMG